jgi:hypothetical protein
MGANYDMFLYLLYLWRNLSLTETTQISLYQKKYFYYPLTSVGRRKFFNIKVTSIKCFLISSINITQENTLKIKLFSRDRERPVLFLSNTVPLASLLRPAILSKNALSKNALSTFKNALRTFKNALRTFKNALRTLKNALRTLKTL